VSPIARSITDFPCFTPVTNHNARSPVRATMIPLGARFRRPPRSPTVSDELCLCQFVIASMAIEEENNHPSSSVFLSMHPGLRERRGHPRCLFGSNPGLPTVRSRQKGPLTANGRRACPVQRTLHTPSKSNHVTALSATNHASLYCLCVVNGPSVMRSMTDLKSISNLLWLSRAEMTNSLEFSLITGSRLSSYMFVHDFAFITPQYHIFNSHQPREFVVSNGNDV
jgi:hypothetical protein